MICRGKKCYGYLCDVFIIKTWFIYFGHRTCSYTHLHLWVVASFKLVVGWKNSDFLQKCLQSRYVVLLSWWTDLSVLSNGEIEYILLSDMID